MTPAAISVRRVSTRKCTVRFRSDDGYETRECRDRDEARALMAQVNRNPRAVALACSGFGTVINGTFMGIGYGGRAEPIGGRRA